MEKLDKATIQIVFAFPPQVHLLDITGPIHIFYEAMSYGAPVKSIFTSIITDDTASESSCALSFSKLISFDKLKLNKGDHIFIPGLDIHLISDPVFKIECAPFRNWLIKQKHKGVIICGVCTGAFLLADSGLLNGVECTTHWKYIDLFKSSYPDAKVLKNRLYVLSENIYTTAGVSAGIDLALHIVEKLWGGLFASKIAREVVIYFRRAIDDPQLSIYTQYRDHIESRVHTVQDHLINNIDLKINIDKLSELVNMSDRNLTRLFKKVTGCSIGEYVKKIRIERAGQLLIEGNTMQTVAESCGLKSRDHLRNIIKAESIKT